MVCMNSVHDVDVLGINGVGDSNNKAEAPGPPYKGRILRLREFGSGLDPRSRYGIPILRISALLLIQPRAGLQEAGRYVGTLHSA